MTDRSPVAAPRDLDRSDAEPALPQAYLAYRARARFGSLDGVRCLSILAVIWHHTTPGLPGWPITHNGFLGVDMFFVLSGFLIVTLLLRERDDTGRISLPAFYMRRTLRIFPVYYGLLLALAAAFFFLRPDSPSAAAYLRALPWYATYTSNWSTTHAVGLELTWSLSTEEQFYLLWPLCEVLLRGRALAAAWIFFFAANQAVNFGLADGWFGGWLGERRPHLNILQATFTPILLGVGLAHFLHNPRAFRLAHRALGHPWSALAALLVLLLACNYPGDLAGAPRLTIQILMAVFLAACVVREDHWARPILSSTPALAIGRVSYGMYLFHTFFVTPSARLADKSGLQLTVLPFLLCAALTYAAAEVSFWTYERPFLHLKRRHRPHAADAKH